MDTEGTFAPDSADEARECYESLGPTAQVVVKEVAKAMGLDADEYRERVTSEVVETARDTLFASLLAVRVGTRDEYEDWLADRDVDVHEVGSEHVDGVVWHEAPAGEVIAATFHDECRAAVGTLRRQAFGRVYADLVAGGEDEDAVEEEDATGDDAAEGDDATDGEDDAAER